MKVEDKMTITPVFVDLSATAEEAAKKMQSENVGTVLVTDRDMLGVSCNLASCGMKAGKIMGECGYRRLPVVQEGEPVGIISISDLAEHAKTCDRCTQSIMKELQ